MAAPQSEYIRAIQMPIKKVFDHYFDVPLYQRPYSWSCKQVDELLNDLRGASKESKEHFLGAIVLANAGKAYGVVDGQQRLTTLAMLLAYGLQWSLGRNNQSLHDQLKALLWHPEDELEAIPARWRIKLKAGDQAFLEANVFKQYLPQDFQWSSDHDQEEADVIEDADVNNAEVISNETHWRIYRNAKRIKQYFDEQDHSFDMLQFLRHVSANCFMVVINCRNETAAFRIFGTINSRGQELSMVDKVKADLLSRLADNDRETYAEQ